MLLIRICIVLLDNSMMEEALIDRIVRWHVMRMHWVRLVVVMILGVARIRKEVLLGILNTNLAGITTRRNIAVHHLFSFEVQHY